MVFRVHLATRNSQYILHSVGYTQEGTFNTASLYWWDKITFLGRPSWHGISWIMNTLNLHSLGVSGKEEQLFTLTQGENHSMAVTRQTVRLPSGNKGIFVAH